MGNDDKAATIFNQMEDLIAAGSVSDFIPIVN
jgi:hypothetical protein